MQKNYEINSKVLRLAPTVFILRRNKNEIQIGLNPKTSLAMPVILADVLTKFDGSNSVQQIINSATSIDLDPGSLLNLIEHLVNIKLLIEAPSELKTLTKNQASHLLDAQRDTNSNPISIKRRTNSHIAIVGAGRLGTSLALLLGNSGFANLRVIDANKVTATDLLPWGASRIDIGIRRDYVVQTLLERIHSGQLKTVRQKETRQKPDLVIYAPDPISDIPWLNPQLTDWAISTDIPHLIAATCPTSSLVSPILKPGKDGCVRCFHFFQTDRDAAWPQLITQLVGRTSPDFTPTALVMQTALLAFQRITGWIDGSSPESSSWSNLTKSLELSHYEIPPHSKCGCIWPLTKFEVA